MTIPNRRFCRFLCVAAVPDQRPGKYSAKFGQGHGWSQIMKTERESVYHVQVTVSLNLLSLGKPMYGIFPHYQFL